MNISRSVALVTRADGGIGGAFVADMAQARVGKMQHDTPRSFAQAIGQE